MSNVDEQLRTAMRHIYRRLAATADLTEREQLREALQELQEVAAEKPWEPGPRELPDE
jgi:hypothetical protein